MLRAQRLRGFESVEMAPGPGLNWLIGANGSGKTTLLEAAYMLSRGHSFRSGGRDAPCRHGTMGYNVYAEVAHGAGRKRLGLGRQDGQWTVHLDGAVQPTLEPLFEHCPVICFEPASPPLIAGPAEERRRFLDWGVFHVEHDYLSVWREYRRALRQRNTLLRSTAPDAEYEPWETALDRLAERIHAVREAYLALWLPWLQRETAELAPELGEIRFDYRPGWERDIGLGIQLAARRDRDREYGHTAAGPHRADWRVGFELVPNREHYSRGQAKIAALACMLAQSALLAEQRGDWPLVCLDDPEAELDREHLRRVIARLAREPAQVWLTTTRDPRGGDSSVAAYPAAVFHVEPERVHRLDD